VKYFAYQHSALQFNHIINNFLGGIYYETGGSALEQKRPTSMPIGDVAWSAKMLSWKQVAVLLKKQDNLIYLMISWGRKTVIKKSLRQTRFSRGIYYY
jgi:hypothetical protein